MKMGFLWVELCPLRMCKHAWDTHCVTSCGWTVGTLVTGECGALGRWREAQAPLKAWGGLCAAVLSWPRPTCPPGPEHGADLGPGWRLGVVQPELCFFLFDLCLG